MTNLMRDASRQPLIIADVNLLGCAGIIARFEKFVRHFKESDSPMDVYHRWQGWRRVPNRLEPGWPSTLELLPMHAELFY